MSNTNFEQDSIKFLVKKLKGVTKYLKTKTKTILIVTILSFGLGALVYLITPVRYTSKMSFVVEEGKSASGGLASIAGQFGIDLGGGSNGGVFSGDNILIFLKSESLCRETLLSYYDSVKKETLADRYAEVMGMKKKWKKNKKIGNISFQKYINNNLPRLEDSLLQIITLRLLKNDFSVSKPDKKATFIQVRTESRDELFSVYFTERLVSNATKRYVDSKTKYKQLNVQSLQKRADSLSDLLNAKTYVSATNQQRLVDVNPALRVAPIALEISSREKTVISAIFSEVVKNLELSKTLLSQETPVIQVIDKSTLPLPKIYNTLVFSIVLYGALGFFFSIFFLFIKSWIKSYL